MSLDVYLRVRGSKTPQPECIYLREGGTIRSIGREEWNVLNPGREPITTESSESDEVYTANITHNLNKMADAAGIYEPLWRPDEVGITKASQLIEPLTAGLALLKSDPARFESFNPANGWGNYAGLVRFVEEYLAACRENPDAEVTVWR